MRAKNTPIRVHLIQNNVTEPLKKARPLGVIGEDPSVKHIRIAKDDAPAFPCFLPGVPWGVSVKDYGGDLDPRLLDHGVNAVLLIT